MQARMRKVYSLVAGLFLLLALYLGWLQVGQGSVLAAHPQNPRARLWEEKAWRGGIFARNGEVLANTMVVNGGLERLYPQGSLTAHPVGYVSAQHGEAGLEALYRASLLGLAGPREWRNRVAGALGGAIRGDDLHLTLDLGLQRLAGELLAGRAGAVVAIDPRTGEVLALASSPSFAPKAVDAAWEGWLAPEAGQPLLDRAVQGLYPPGSTMKLVTAAAALTASPWLAEQTYSCPGEIVVEGRRLACTRAHGDLTLKEALAYSCNVTLVRVALATDRQVLSRVALAFGFDRPLPFDLSAKQSSAGLAGAGANGVAEAAIGQGRALATPMQMAMVAAAIANGGELLKPRLVRDGAAAWDGSAWPERPRVWEQSVSPGVAAFLREAMVMAVASGTARGAAVPGYQVAGKTGTAQNPQGADHSWFVGFAPAEHPVLAVAVVVENAGAGGEVAAPLAGRLFKMALK